MFIHKYLYAHMLNRLQSDRDGEISYGIPYILNLKRNDTMNLFTKQKHTDRKNLWLSLGGWRDGKVMELGIGMYILLSLQWNIRTYHIAKGTLVNVSWQPG